MSILVPAVLGGLALLVITIVSLLGGRRSRKQQSKTVPQSAAPKILVHSINDDRCTGCDACVAVCPTNVLDLVSNKSRVLRFADCIQCEACMWACPTNALVMHPEGSTAPSYKMPELDEFYQTKISGQYLIGEVAGKPLVKNAANLGRAVIEHACRGGLAPSPTSTAQVGGYQGIMVDVVIVGSGPGGLSAALTCINKGLSYVVIEKENFLASTVARYPKGKWVMAEPYETPNLSFLPVYDSTKEEILPIWQDLINQVGLNLKCGETVEKVVKEASGRFHVQTNVSHYFGRRVVLATGTRGKPRTLGVPGENLSKVQSLLDDADAFRGKPVLVVGGGDSALEATIALADAGAKVALCYRGKSFTRAQQKNRQAIESYQAQRRIKVILQSEVKEFGSDTVTLRLLDGTQKRYPNVAAFVLIGSDPPIEWLGTLGVRFVDRPHMFALPQSDVLVRRFVANAELCGMSAAHAAAQVYGRSFESAETALAGRADSVSVSVSRPRRWLSQASALIKVGKLERPASMGGFGQVQRPDGTKRDRLEPRERTRVLRMLRDEGGRVADEDSRVAKLSEPHPKISDLGNRSFSDAVNRSNLGNQANPLHASANPAPLHLPAEEMLLDEANLLATQEVLKVESLRSERPIPKASFFDEPTRQIGEDRVQELMRILDQQGIAQDRVQEQSLHLGGKLPPGSTHTAPFSSNRPDSFEEPTVAVDYGALMEWDPGAFAAVSSVAPTPDKGGKRQSQATMSDVDWDLD